MIDINLDTFEPIFVKGIISDQSVLANLSSYLIDPKKIFKNKNFINLVKFYKLYFDKYTKIPSKTEISVLKDSKLRDSLINSIEELEKTNYSDLDSDTFFKMSEQFIKERLIWTAMVTIASELNQGSVDTTEILHKFEEICSISLDNSGGLDLYEDIDQIIDKLKHKNDVISTGFKSIDQYIDGGMYAAGRALYLLMAPPNKGKSLFLGNIACNVANAGKNVLVISLEMSEISYAARFCSQQSSIPFAELHLRADELKEKFKNSPGKIIIKEFPPSSITPMQLKAWIDKNIINKGVKIDLIAIDYLNLFDGPGSNLYEKIKNIVEQTRALSYIYSVPVLSLTQQNRSASGKEQAGLNSVSESSGTSMTADVILEIFENEEDTTLNYKRVGFAKNRYGPVNIAVVTKINYDTLRITDLEEQESYQSSLDKSVESELLSFV